MRNRVDDYTDVKACQSWRRPVAWLILIALLTNPLAALGQTGSEVPNTLRAGDKVELTVPGRPDLDIELSLDDEGRVNIPQVGEVPLGGMTKSEATLFIKQKLRLFHPNIDAIELEIIRGGSTKIYVMGQVARTGVQSFDHVPTLWDVLRSVGGPTEFADLRSSRLIREVDGIPQVHPLDLSGIMEGRSVPTFDLEDSDTLVIPALLEGTSGVPSDDGVKVFGAVGVVTTVPIDAPMPMLDVLMLAGAPTVEAEMKEIYWVHQDGAKAQSTVVNLEDYLKWGDPLGNPTVYPGDTLHVKKQVPSMFWKYVPPLVGLVAGILAIVLMVDRLTNPYNTSSSF
jgi:protein involved in polysaccharide export with SLBB domain